MKIINALLRTLLAGVVGGGVASSLADAEIEALHGAVLSLFAPAGAVATETNSNYKGPAMPAPAAPPSSAAVDWPSYNKTLTSERFSEL
jgi:alcohol dehydrogenase (cytochrome c)